MTNPPALLALLLAASACSRPSPRAGVAADERADQGSLRIGSISGSAEHSAPPTGPAIQPGRCGLSRAAFCETFATRHPGGRAGDLDEKVWSIGRWGHETRQFFVRIPASTLPETVFPAVFCGRPFSKLLPYQDVAICDGRGLDGQVSGQLNEVFHDQGDFAYNSFRIRQLFDFTDRTGTIVFDVDAKINPFNVGHGWWVELFITEDPAPMPYHEAPGVLSFPRNGVGFAFQGFNSCAKSKTLWHNALNRVFVTRNHEILHDYGDRDLQYDSWDGRCFRTADLESNRFKFLISRSSAEVWVTDHDAPHTLRRLARAENLDLPFSRGYVHLQHAQYNARKDGDVTPVQVYRWDNVGFDGPAHPLPRSYEVEDNDQPDIDQTGGRMYGYPLKDDSFVRLALKGVDRRGTTKATLGFTILVDHHGRALEYRFNRGPTRVFQLPRFGPPGGVRGFAIDVPLADLIDGDNQLELKMAAPQPYPYEAVANVDLTLEVAK